MPALATRETPIVARPPADPIVIRRFELPDLAEHGGWLLERMLEVYPHVTRQMLNGWLNTILYNNEFLFLYQKDGVALAQTMHGHTLAPQPIIQERFVFVRDKADQAQIERAAAFYSDFLRWGKAQDAEAVILSDWSDVPNEMAAKYMGGRLFEKKQVFIRVT